MGMGSWWGSDWIYIVEAKEMRPCENDWGGLPNEPSVAHVALSLSAQIPTRVIVELPKPKIGLTVSFNFTDWEQTVCRIPYKDLWRWYRTYCFDVCNFGLFFASDLGVRDIRQGTFTIYLDMPDLPLGDQVVEVKVIAAALYHRRRYTSCLPLTYEEYDALIWKDNKVRGSVKYLQGKPLTKFSVDKSSGAAPLTVRFTNETTVSDPMDPTMEITSWLWDFGDGNVSQSPENQTHVFYKPGTYTVKLTASNSYGSSTASMDIKVIAGPVSPLFSDRCVFPAKVQVGVPFAPAIFIDNQGGPGYIDMWAVCGSTRIQILDDFYISGYTRDISVSVPYMTPEAWLGFTPEENVAGTWTFYVGPSGQTWTDKKVFTAVVWVGEAPECILDSDCPEGFVCVNNVCVPVSQQKESKAILLLGAAGVVAGSLYLLSQRRK